MATYYAIVRHEPEDTYLLVDHVKNIQIYENKSCADLYCPDHCEVIKVVVKGVNQIDDIKKETSATFDWLISLTGYMKLDTDNSNEFGRGYASAISDIISEIEKTKESIMEALNNELQ